MNKNKEKESFNWSMLFILSLGGVAIGVYRDGFSSLFPFLQRDFDLTRAQLGLHSSIFFFISAFLAMFAGRLVDLKGSKWGMVSGILFLGIFMILHSLAPNFIVLLTLAAFTGLVVSTNLPASTKGIIEWFPQKWRSTALGIQSTGFPIGGMLAAIFLPFLGNLIGWRKTILVAGIFTLLCSFIVLRFYHNKEKDTFKINDTDTISFWESFKQLTKNSKLLNFSIYGFFLGATAGSIAAHFSLFLYLDYGLSEIVAGMGLAVVQLGGVLGRIVWAQTSDRLLKTNKSKTFLYMGSIFVVVSLIVSLFLKNFNSLFYVVFLFPFLVGFSGRGWQGIYFASIAETIEKDQIGIAIGFSTILMQLGLMLAPPIFGYIADLKGTYTLSWLLLGLMLFLASIGQYLFYTKICQNKTE